MSESNEQPGPGGNINLKFDEALELHFGIGQALARIGGYKAAEESESLA